MMRFRRRLAEDFRRFVLLTQLVAIFRTSNDSFVENSSLLLGCVEFGNGCVERQWWDCALGRPSSLGFVYWENRAAGYIRSRHRADYFPRLRELPSCWRGVTVYAAHL